MRIVRYKYKDAISFGAVEEDCVLRIEGEPFDGITYTGEEIPLKEARLLSPTEPRNIVAVGLNYKQHSEEFGMPQTKEPLLFSKPASAVIGPGETIEKPQDCQRLDFEAELAVVMGKRCRMVREKNAGEYIFGYTCLNDVTARDIQERDSQWLRAKGFYTFCPIGPWIETDIDISDISVRSVLNGKIMQEDRTSSMMFKVPYLVSYISGFMELLPGDIIATGTPGGHGPMRGGDRIEIEIEGIGRLVNHVK